jgi:hypothetical protein
MRHPLHMDPQLRKIKLGLNILDFPLANFKLSIIVRDAHLDTINPVEILNGRKVNQE